ncbi:MAG: PAS domain S-box protein [Deltaproteobacteria bacterium]|nr:PAS domain S-box protein [Deltaproteobacteria bacterium]
MTTTWPQSTSLRIHRRIILTFILTTLFSILLVGTTLRYVVEKTTMDNWKKRQEFVTLEFAPQCDHEIQEAQRDLEFVSKMAVFSKLFHIDQIDPSLGGVPENIEVEKRQIFRDLMALGEKFSSLIILRPNGDLYLVHPFKTQRKVKRRNFRDRAYFREAVRTKRPVVSDSFMSAAGNPVLVIAVPVLDKAGDITAVIGGGFYLTNLSKLVDKKEIGTFDLGFIVDKKGRLIAHTDTKLLQKEIRNSYIEHALVSKFLHKSPHDGSKVMIEDCVDPVDGKHYLTSFVQLQSGWGLGLALSRETVLSEIRPAVWRITILVSFIILVVGTIGALFTQWVGRRWVSTEKALVKQTYDLDERVKELNCLYYVSKLVENPGFSLNEIFQEVVEIIPPAWQYPEITCAQIVVADKEYQTENFKETSWKQSSGIFVHKEQIGTLEVIYLEEKPEIYEGPFSKEERRLIDEIADRLRMIIEHRQAETALKEERDRAQTYLDLSPVMFIAINTGGEVILVNEKGCELLGYDEEEILGKNWFENFLPERLREEMIPVSKKLLSGEIDGAEYYENPVLTRQGEERLMAWHNTVLKDDQGKIVGHLSSGEDITKRKRAEEALKQHHEQLEERVHDRTAELRSIVNAMSGREIRMAELKKAIKKLRAQLEGAGMTPVADDPIGEA